MLMKHAVRTSYTQLFIKCAIPSCTHCSRHPVHAVESLQFLRDHQGRMLTPHPSLTHPGHFSTFLECVNFCTPRQKALGLDEGLPSLQHVEEEKKVCSVCKRYVFVSKADKDRHLLLIHDQRSAKRKADQGVHISRCGKEFATHYQLIRHKKDTGHKCQRGRKRSHK